jgi:hypothetical protein
MLISNDTKKQTDPTAAPRGGLVDAKGIQFDSIANENVRKGAVRDKVVAVSLRENVVAHNARELKGTKTHSNPERASERSASERLLAEAIKGEYRYGMLGLILGITSIICGVVLCLNGVAGSTSWTARVLAMESKVNDAAPGVVLFIVGLFFVWVTKPKVKLRDLQG